MAKYVLINQFADGMHVELTETVYITKPFLLLKLSIDWNFTENVDNCDSNVC